MSIVFVYEYIVYIMLLSAFEEEGCVSWTHSFDSRAEGHRMAVRMQSFASSASPEEAIFDHLDHWPSPGDVSYVYVSMSSRSSALR